MVNWGNTHYDQAGVTSENPFKGPLKDTVSFLGAPFTLDKSYGIQTIADGTSNTLLISEVIIGQPNGTCEANIDHRAPFNDDHNSAMFMAYTAPNSTTFDQVTSWCVYPYATNPPCNTLAPAFNAARSFHPGGVNCASGRRPGPVLQELDQPADLARPEHHDGGRGDQLRRLLTLRLSRWAAERTAPACGHRGVRRADGSARSPPAVPVRLDDARSIRSHDSSGASATGKGAAMGHRPFAAWKASAQPRIFSICSRRSLFGWHAPRRSASRRASEEPADSTRAPRRTARSIRSHDSSGASATAMGAATGHRPFAAW